MDELIVFVKYPEPGEVKTRLASSVGAETAAQVYRQLAQETMEHVRPLHGSQLRVTVACDPPERVDDIRTWLGSEVHYQAQHGTTLGDRLQSAIESSLTSSVGRVVIIGSDAPDIRAAHVQRALESLTTHDVVLGPAADGGYYLIAMSSPHPELFQDISWSSPHVLTETIERIRQSRLRYELLATLADVDEYEGWTTSSLFGEEMADRMSETGATAEATGNISNTLSSAQANSHAAADIEAAVRQRYTAGAQALQPELCCPVDYNTEYLKVVPHEIIERDYGCGDPSRYVQEADTVLDLGCGAGKICYVASQIVGPKGRVIGVDINTEMLALARRYQEEVARRIGYGNVDFRRGKIQDLRTDLDQLDARLAARPVASAEDYLELESTRTQLAHKTPLVPDASVDVIISNCVLNLVRSTDKQQLFNEMFRVLKRGGRVAISDIVSDEPVPEHLQQDPELWSGCISGAFQEDEFLKAFEDAGFYGVQIASWSDEPFRTVEGIEFRSVTVTACKGKEGPCLERLQAVIYQGPWKQVLDDDGHVLKRGERTAVCDKTFKIYAKAPYADSIIPIFPRHPIALDEAAEFDCHRTEPRHPRETKGVQYRLTTEEANSCGPEENCC